MDEKVPLSVALIAMNEAEALPDCLRSVSFARQIVVVDSGSTDDTVPIASGFGCEVFQETWRGFGPQKQSAVAKCREDWVLVLDADERIPTGTGAVIREIVSAPPGAVSGYSFPRRNFFQGRWIRHAGWWPDRVVRLFRRERGYITGAAVHEAVVVNGSVKALDVPIEHITESRLTMILQKIDRYSTLGAAEAFARGRRSTIHSALLRAKLAFFQNYFIRGGFLDGTQGLTLAVTDAINKFFKYAKLSELSRNAGTRDGKKRKIP